MSKTSFIWFWTCCLTAVVLCIVGKQGDLSGATRGFQVFLDFHSFFNLFPLLWVSLVFTHCTPQTTFQLRQCVLLAARSFESPWRSFALDSFKPIREARKQETAVVNVCVGAAMLPPPHISLMHYRCFTSVNSDASITQLYTLNLCVLREGNDGP